VVDLMREWDSDRSGFIGKEEFGSALQAMGFECTRADLDRIFNELDEDHTGALAYQELAANFGRCSCRRKSSAGSFRGGASAPGGLHRQNTVAVCGSAPSCSNASPETSPPSRKLRRQSTGTLAADDSVSPPSHPRPLQRQSTVALGMGAAGARRGSDWRA
jgi:hypothetical protein